jgi:hypothetical protein
MEFRTHQDRLPKELLAKGITTIEQADRYIREVYLSAFKPEFTRQASEPGLDPTWATCCVNILKGQ